MTALNKPVTTTAAIVLADSTREFDRPYTYLVPVGMSLQPGMRVLVPFGRGNKLRDGWVIHPQVSPEQPEVKKSYRLKAVAEQMDAEPLLGPDLMRLAAWMRERFFCTWHQALSTMVPAGARLVVGEDGTYRSRGKAKTIRAMNTLLSSEQIDEMVQNGGISNSRQLHVLELLIEEGRCPVETLYLIPGVNSATLLAMKKKGWLEESRIQVERDPFADLQVEPREPPLPTCEQEASYNTLLPLLDRSPGTEGFPEALLFGVTGSGKTEVYLRLISACLERGRGALMLVPEISLTPQTVERFIQRFGQRVAVLHSRLSVGERLDQWRRIRAGELDVVVGARSAIFAPLANLGAIIIDEEHEGAYKSETSPRYDARLVARARSNLTGALLVYGSATPSVETFHRAESGRLIRVNLLERVAGRPLPEVVQVDMRQELAGGNRGPVSRLLESAMKETRLAGEQAILFLNRRGLAASLLCGGCGAGMKCPHCSVSLVMHRRNRLLCHHCGHVEPVPKRCPACQSEQLIPIGTGTQKLETELAERMEGYRVLRMDLDSTTGKDGHRKILDRFRNGEADILVGTQMVAKGHDFPNVTLVGILSADGMLHTGDYRASERTFQLLAQAAGRAGRAEKPGRVILQAYNVDDYSLIAARSHDYEGFYRQEIAMRQRIGLPPFCHLGMVQLSAETSEAVIHAASLVTRLLHVQIGKYKDLECSDAMPSPLPVLNGRHRMRIILKHRSVKILQGVLGALLDDSRKPLRESAADLTVDIDPGAMV